jgi:hypothetical protein
VKDTAVGQGPFAVWSAKKSFSPHDFMVLTVIYSFLGRDLFRTLLPVVDISSKAGKAGSSILIGERKG